MGQHTPRYSTPVMATHSLGEKLLVARLGLNRSHQRINHTLIRVTINLFSPWCQGLLFTQHFVPEDF